MHQILTGDNHARNPFLYIQEMIDSGQVRELNADEQHGDWNHRLLLVYRQDGKKLFVSSKADKLSGKARIEALAKSSRLVSDMKALNDISVSWGKMWLPKLHELLPVFSGKMVSTADIRSGYSNVLLDYWSSLKTAFVHRNRKYVYLV